jgi:AcrR family transcriptional regulator
MSPRAYRSHSRDSASAETRSRIIESARALLSTQGAVTFTIDAIAEGANVARMTVYNQFGSKRGLVEALSDDLAARGGIGRLPEAFQAKDALTGLEVLVEVFTGFWERERLVLRRLRAVTTLDPELSRSDRDGRRRQALAVLLHRLSAETGRPAPEEIDTAADVLLVLTSFEAYESLAAEGRDQRTVAQLVIAAAKPLFSLPSEGEGDMRERGLFQCGGCACSLG